LFVCRRKFYQFCKIPHKEIKVLITVYGYL